MAKYGHLFATETTLAWMVGTFGESIIHTLPHELVTVAPVCSHTLKIISDW